MYFEHATTTLSYVTNIDYIFKEEESLIYQNFNIIPSVNETDEEY
jgi:hypothetical protein